MARSSKQSPYRTLWRCSTEATAEAGRGHRQNVQPARPAPAKAEGYPEAAQSAQGMPGRRQIDGEPLTAVAAGAAGQNRNTPTRRFKAHRTPHRHAIVHHRKKRQRADIAVCRNQRHMLRQAAKPTPQRIFLVSLPPPSVCRLSGVNPDHPLERFVGTGRPHSLDQPLIIAGEQVITTAEGRIPRDMRKDDRRLSQRIETKPAANCIDIQKTLVDLRAKLVVPILAGVADVQLPIKLFTPVGAPDHIAGEPPRRIGQRIDIVVPVRCRIALEHQRTGFVGGVPSDHRNIRLPAYIQDFAPGRVAVSSANTREGRSSRMSCSTAAAEAIDVATQSINLIRSLRLQSPGRPRGVAGAPWRPRAPPP